MLIKRSFSVILVVITTLFLVACSSTKMVTEWHEKDYQDGQLNRFLVIGAINSDLYRRAYEDAMVEKFQENGIEAVSSYTLMATLEEYDDEEKLKKAVSATRADGVIVARLIDFDESEQYIPPSYDVSPSLAMGMGRGYYNSYHMGVHASYRPGYTQTTTKIRIGSEAFSADDEKLIWAVETESFNPNTYQSVINKLADITMSSLRKNGFVK